MERLYEVKARDGLRRYVQAGSLREATSLVAMWDGVEAMTVTEAKDPPPYDCKREMVITKALIEGKAKLGL